MNKNSKLYSTVFLSPFKYLRPSVRTEAYFMLALLVPQLVMLAVTESYESLVIIAASTLAAVCVEVIDMNFCYKDKFTWVLCCLKGIIIGLLLPQAFPPLPVFFVTFFSLLFNRFILGGFANSWINPVAITVAICWLIGMKFFPLTTVSITELQSRNPALALIQNGTFPLNSVDVKITSFLNQKIFSLFKVSIPDGYVSLLWDSHSSIPAFRFNFLCILSSIFLIGFDIINPIIPACYIAVYSILIKFVAPFFYSGPLMQGDIILALMTSGTLFCTFFILQWHGTTPFTNRGKLFYGIIAGITAFFIVGCGTSPSGMIFTILIINILSLLIQSVENYFSHKYAESNLKARVQSIKDGTNA